MTEATRLRSKPLRAVLVAASRVTVNFLSAQGV